MFKLNKDLLSEIIKYVRGYDYVFNKVLYGTMVSHPFSDSNMRYVPNIKKEDEFKENVLDLENEKDRDIFYEWILKEFENSEFAEFFYCVVNKVYRLRILMFVVNELEIEVDKNELALLFTQSYETTELPYQDFNCIMEFYYILKGMSLQRFSTKVAIVCDDMGMVEVYRGQLEGHEFNISWTTDYEVAKFFSKRWGKKGVVYKAKVRKKDIWYTSNDRSEKEIVLKPPILKYIRDYEII